MSFQDPIDCPTIDPIRTHVLNVYHLLPISSTGVPYEWGLTSPHQKVTNRLTVVVTESQCN